MVISAMRHFATELEAEGFDVDHRQAPTLAAGLRAHSDEFRVERVLATSPSSHDAVTRLEALGVELSTNTFFITDYRKFGEWADGRKRIRMEDFYRRQRIDLDVLMDGDEPAGGTWNFDHENREPPPKDGRAWPTLELFPLDAIDCDVMTELEVNDDIALWGAAPDGRWPVTRAQALERLQRFVDEGLPGFGAHEDAMLAAEWKLAHSVLSSAMNIGLLDPMEVVRAAEVADEHEVARRDADGRHVAIIENHEEHERVVVVADGAVAAGVIAATMAAPTASVAAATTGSAATAYTMTATLPALVVG